MKSGTRNILDARRTRMIPLLLLLLMACNAKSESASSVAEQSRAIDQSSTPDAGRAAGTLTVDGKTIRIRFAYARRIKGRFDPTKQETDLISETPSRH